MIKRFVGMCVSKREIMKSNGLQAEKEGEPGDVKVPLCSEQLHAILQLCIQMTMFNSMILPAHRVLPHFPDRVDPQHDEDQQEAREVQIGLSAHTGQKSRL